MSTEGQEERPQLRPLCFRARKCPEKVKGASEDDDFRKVLEPCSEKIAKGTTVQGVNGVKVYVGKIS